MSNTRPQMGQIVVNPAHPEWGPGKVLYRLGDRAYIYWRDREDQKTNELIRPLVLTAVSLDIALQQSDRQLDNLPPFDHDKKRLATKKNAITAAQSVSVFLSLYPKAFHDPQYMKDERGYKVAASSYAKGHLGGDAIPRMLASNRIADLAHACMHAVTLGPMNLLSPYELMALKESLANELAAHQYFTALYELVSHDALEETRFQQYCKAVASLPAEVGRARVNTWPVATILPFLIRPETFAFVKPTPTRRCAENLAWNLNYNATPNWLTYSCVLNLSQWLRDDLLPPYGPHDMIDIQSFMWVVAEHDGL